MKVYVILRGIQEFDWGEMAYYPVFGLHSIYETEDGANAARTKLVLEEKEEYRKYWSGGDVEIDRYGIEIPHDVFRIQPYEVL